MKPYLSIVHVFQVANHQEGGWRPQDVNQLIGKICKTDIPEEEVILKTYIET